MIYNAKAKLHQQAPQGQLTGAAGKLRPRLVQCTSCAGLNEQRNYL